ncbi:MAG: hypothetical protein P0111_06100 [Nitrospira sp.]|nr:hypothetical protein [Nitrospira sp.]
MQAGSPAVSVFLLATMIVVVGTALIDAVRLPLVMIPASFLLAAYGAGQFAVQIAGSHVPPIPRHLPMVGLTRRLAIGVSLIGIAATLLGLSGVYPWTGILVMIACGWGCYSLIQTGKWRTLRIDTGILVGGIGIGLVWTVAWLWGTVPPAFYDELAYHLPIPQSALRTGNLPASPWSWFTLMPHLSDLLLGWGLAVGGELGARALHLALWFGIWIAAWGLVEAIHPLSQRKLGLLLAGTFSSSATVFFLGTLPFAECSLTFGVLASLALILAPSLRADWIAVGLLWGFVMSVKLSGPSWILASGLAALMVGWPLRSVVAAAALGIGCAAPWWIRSWALTGNPLYPLGYKWIGSRYWTDTSEKLLQQDLPHFADASELGAWLRLPYDLVAYPERFGSASDVGLIAVLGLCLMLTLPMWTMLLRSEGRVQRIARAVSVFVIVSGACWILTSTTVRFFAPTFMLGLTLISAFTLRCRPPVQAAAMLAFTTLGIMGTDRFITQHSDVFSSDQIVLGRESRSEYLSRTVDHFESAQYVRAHVPSDARLLFIGESRPFYFERSTLAPYPFHEHPLAVWLKDATSADQVVDHLRAEGITHVVLNTREFKRLHDAYHVLAFDGTDGPLLDQRLKRLPGSMTLLFAKNNVFVFEVPSLRQPSKPS